MERRNLINVSSSQCSTSRSRKLPEGPAWQYEVKLDGYRAIGVRTKAGVELWSRSMRDFSRRFPNVARCLESRRAGNSRRRKKAKHFFQRVEILPLTQARAYRGSSRRAILKVFACSKENGLLRWRGCGEVSTGSSRSLPPKFLAWFVGGPAPADGLYI